MEGLKLKLAARPPPIRYLGHLSKPDSGSDPIEFQESDVIWSPDYSDPDPIPSPRTPTSPKILSGNPSLVRQRPAINPALSAVSGAVAVPQSLSGRSGMAGPTRMSAPVNVPVWPGWKEGSGRRSGEFEDEEEDWGSTYEKMVPPHEIVAQSHSTTAFSVFEGAGRTLKGRDLRRVRNTVFRKTGFLD